MKLHSEMVINLSEGLIRMMTEDKNDEGNAEGLSNQSQKLLIIF